MTTQNTYNDTFIRPSLYLEQTDTIMDQTYKLIIQVDKVRARPGPKSKKRKLMTITTNNYKQSNKFSKVQNNNTNNDVNNAKVMTSDTHQQLTENSEGDNSTTSRNDTIIDVKSTQCPICLLFFNSIQSLYIHKRKHSVCQLCGVSCESKLLCDYHAKIHQSIDPIYPYKCNLCSKTFDNIKNLKVHSKMSHMNTISIIHDNSVLPSNHCNDNLDKSKLDKQKYQCKICRVALKDEDEYSSHVVSHSVQIDVNGDNSTHEMNLQLNDEKNSKFSCKFCNMHFNNHDEAESHKITHAEIIEADNRKCNVCKKLFKTDKMLNDHLAYHLSQAHYCNICHKAFINRTTLRNHMRTHMRVK